MQRLASSSQAPVQTEVDVLKIHTNGGERQILDGAEKLFVRHEVHRSSKRSTRV